MSKKLLIFTCIAVISLFSGSQLKKYFTKLNKPGDIVFLKDIHDFGELEYGQEASVYFRYQNLGSKSVEINEVISSCGCTVPEWKKSLLGADEIDSLLVTYDTNSVGYFSKEIVIVSNIYDEDRIWITGTVFSPKDSMNN